MLFKGVSAFSISYVYTQHWWAAIPTLGYYDTVVYRKLNTLKMYTNDMHRMSYKDIILFVVPLFFNCILSVYTNLHCSRLMFIEWCPSSSVLNQPAVMNINKYTYIYIYCNRHSHLYGSPVYVDTLCIP